MPIDLDEVMKLTAVAEAATRHQLFAISGVALAALRKINAEAAAETNAPKEEPKPKQPAATTAADVARRV